MECRDAQFRSNNGGAESFIRGLKGLRSGGSMVVGII